MSNYGYLESIRQISLARDGCCLCVLFKTNEERDDSTKTPILCTNKTLPIMAIDSELDIGEDIRETARNVDNPRKAIKEKEYYVVLHVDLLSNIIKHGYKESSVT